MTAVPETTWVVDLPDIQSTERFAAMIAAELGPNTLVTLTGDLGSGKTTFARALIRSLTGKPDLEVPSPTFTLMQVYDGPRFPIVHCDLYRIGGPEELAELGWDEASADALVLVEWADRAGDVLQADKIDIGFILEPEEGPEHRVAVVTGSGAWAQRVSIMKAIEKLLTQTGWADAKREFMLGDASVRAYERLRRGDETAILMISPPRPDGPPVRYGKPYSAIARLAEDVKPFVALANGLRDFGYSAPGILGMDLKTGLLLTEDLGHETVLVDGRPDPERYLAAIEVLADMHGRSLPDRLPVTDDIEHRIPNYDLDALLIEVELLLDWYLPHMGRLALSASSRGQFVNAWKAALTEIVMAPRTWVLRDYHSPNLMWLPGREGLRRIGIIDFQDAVMGHPAYDVASLAQDARVDLPEGLELRLVGHYARLRKAADPDFGMAAFARDYSIMGAQRATKILGIFARLDRRDGKPQYLKHLPRIEAYARTCLAHPALAELRAWYQTHIPGLFPEPPPVEDGADKDG
ncbi:MAG: tRNA (adenosine(37)-N6)-threonylcarbamoyltransferase complex ATPase subunit type 1 TsaE [Beijerinckiaceae bacterium]